ncbi:MAG TPA: TadE family protein [Chloroflexota bacterium]|nr:TadE family protein [Chloroflexota bacterium]
MIVRRFIRVAERGTSTLELALIVPVLLTLVIGAFDLSWSVILSNMTSQAAREGARAAIVRLNPTDAGCPTSVPAAVATPIAAAARNQVAAPGGGTFAVSTSAGGTIADACYVQVSVSTTYQPVAGAFLNQGSRQVGATSRQALS